MNTEEGYCPSCGYTNKYGECTLKGPHKFDFSEVPEWAEQFIRKCETYQVSLDLQVREQQGNVNVTKVDKKLTWHWSPLPGSDGPCADWGRQE